MIRWIFFVLVLALQGCNVVNDYWLGKDNTPKATPLKPIKEQAKFVHDWQVPVGSGKSKSVFLRLKPALAGDAIHTATEEGTIKSIKAQNGQVNWETKLKTKLVSGPAVKDGIVVVGTGHASIIALSQETGKQLWEAETSGEVLATPLISKDTVMVKTVDGRVYAFKASNGDKHWVVDHGAPNIVLRASSAPTFYNQLMIAGFSDGKLDAIDMDTGHVAWQRSMGFASGSSDVDRMLDISTDPLIWNHTVYLASYQGYLVAMSLRQGEFLWTKPVSTYRNLGMDDYHLYMTDSEDIVWSIDNDSGKVLWKQPMFVARHVTAPAVLDKYLVVGDKEGALHLISKRHGDVVARETLSGAIDASPVVSEDAKHVYVLTSKHELHRFSVKDVMTS